MADYDPTQDSGTAYFCKIVLYDFFWFKVILYMKNDVKHFFGTKQIILCFNMLSIKEIPKVEHM